LHAGEPEYEKLFVFSTQQVRVGPEPADLPQYNEKPGEGFVDFFLFFFFFLDFLSVVLVGTRKEW
jgi:hypothetical protein